LFDGSKAERDLGIRYTPIRVAFEEAVRDSRVDAGLGVNHDET
jgi:hypothetical protein